MPRPSVVVKNETSPRGAVHIIQIACKFIYDDGFNDNQSKNTDVAPGGQDALYAVHDECCRSYIGFLQVRYPDGTTETLAGSKNVEAGYCGGELIWHITSSVAIEGWVGDHPKIVLSF